MIVFESVSKNIITDISVNIPAGETVGLIGSTGSGKTTLMKLACGLLKPERGHIWTLGKDPVTCRGGYASDISVFINGIPLLDREITVRAGFGLIAAVYGIPKAEYSERYAELSEKLGFGAFDESRVKDLSNGQRMRAEIGAALIYEPKLLLLDEPCAGLDENARYALGEIVGERAAAGCTTLLTSNDMAVVSGFCTRLAMLDKGRLVYYGSEDGLRSRYMPINTMTVRFSGKIPDLDDLPLTKYTLAENTITLGYNSNHITAAEITALLLKQTEITEISIHKPSLEDIVRQTGEKK